MTLLNPTAVLAKRHVQLPMQAILHPPVIPQRRTVSLHAATPAADKITHFARGLSRHRPLAVTFANHRQLLPVLLAANPFRIMNQFVNTLLLPPMPLLHRLIRPIPYSLAVLVIILDETSLDVGTQMFLIVFHGQHVIPAARYDLGRDRFLAAHGV